MVDHNLLLDYKANNLNDETKNEVKTYLLKVLANPDNLQSEFIGLPSMDAVRVLFNIYNEHIYQYPNCVTCSDSAKAVLNFWRKHVIEWQT